MRLLRLTAVLASCLALTGCLQATTVITVKPDGSGTLEQTTLMSAAAIAQFRQIAGGLAGPNAKSVDPFSEDQERAEAQRVPGVTFVSSTPVRTPEGEGRRTLYSFTDISQVKVNERPRMPGSMSMRSDQMNTKDIEPISFTMTKSAAGNPVLTVHFPEPAIPPPSQRPPEMKNPPTAEKIALARRLFAGTKLGIAVETASPLVHTDSPFVQGNRVTLFEMDVDQLIKDEAVLPRLQATRSVEEAKRILRDVPGMKINPGRDVTIEFAAR